jgi:hypothetical protein
VEFVTLGGHRTADYRLAVATPADPSSAAA